MRSEPAQKLQSQALSDALHLSNQKRSYFPRGTDVGATTGASVQVSYGDDADSSGPLRSFSQSLHLLRIFEADVDRAVLHDDLVRPFLDLLRLLEGQGARIQVESRALLAEVNGNGPIPQQAGHDGRQKMLSRMLLHVIKATRPVHPPGDTIGHEAGIEQVSD